MVRKLPLKQYVKSIAKVAALSFKIAPLAVGFKLMGSIVDAGLPIIITVVAAQTTTLLAVAYGGDRAAGEQALWYVILTVGLGLLSTVWRSIDQYLQQVMRYRVESKVSDVMYERFVSLEFWRYDDKDTVDLYDRAKQFSTFFAWVFDRLSSLTTQLISLIFALIALTSFAPWLGLLVLAGVIPGLIIQLKLSRAQITHWNKTVATRRSQNFIESALLRPQAIAELRLNNLVRHLLELRQGLRDKDERTRLNFERHYIGRRLLADALESGVELAALIWVTLQIMAAKLPIGQFIFVQQMVSRALGSANNFVREISSLDEDLANLVDYEAFMELPVHRGGTHQLSQSPQRIRFEAVSFHYPQTQKSVLQNVSFEITAGEHVAIVGENGAGKSTLIKLLTGLYNPTKGQVLLDNQPLIYIDVSSWHRHIAVLQQDFQKYNFTDVAGNVAFGDVMRRRDAHHITEALAQAEATEFVDKLPKKLQTLPSPWMEDEHGNKGIDLSGGQWQRLALARGFYRNSPIIILDEPTSAIDALAEHRIFKRLFARSNSKTVITISHRLSTVEKADKILVLAEGKLVEVGTHAELVAKRGAYYHTFESQLHE